MRSSTTRPTGRSRRRPRFSTPIALAASVAAVAVLGGCTDDSAWDDPLPTVPLLSATEVSPLRVVDDCDTLEEGARAVLTSAAASMWPEQASTTMPAMADGAGDDSGAADSGVADSSAQGFTSESATAAPTTGAAESTQRMSAAADTDQATGTNNQEAGVDESDLVKTDGARIVSVVNGVLRVTVLDDAPAVDGSLDLSMRAATELFLRGDTALVIGSAYSGVTPMVRGSGSFDEEIIGEGGVIMEDGAATDMVVPQARTADAPPTTTGPTATLPDPERPTTTTTVGPDAPTTTAGPTTTAPTTTVPTTTAPTTTVAPAPPLPPEPVLPPFTSGTTLTLVSLEDPTAPRVVQTAEVEGSLVSARQVGDTARIVLRSEPIAMYEMMQATDGAAARAIASEVDSDALLPRIAIDGEIAPLGGCADVLLTAAPVDTAAVDQTSGVASSDMAASSTSWTSQALPSTVTVLTVDDTLDDVRPVSVQGTAETIYASTDALYVASGGWDEAGSRTDVHRFDLPADGPAVYTGTGRVPGRLLNQFSLSDHEGALRVVTTVDGPVGGAPATTVMPDTDDDALVDEARMPSTSARLTVLDTEGEVLDEVGHLDGLGVGEEVQSVRFMGDTGYVVTFRQTDPLYALDLTDPSAPRSLGELKIPGFSEYLHPVGDGLLLGIGRDADPTSGMDRGFKASLFDVSDPAAMVEVDQLILPNAWSEVSSDHKAFTWDAERSQAIFPLTGDCGPAGDCSAANSAMVLRVEGGQLDEVARITHGTGFGSSAPMRSIVIDDDLWTLSYEALGRSDAAAPTSVELVRF